MPQDNETYRLGKDWLAGDASRAPWTDEAAFDATGVADAAGEGFGNARPGGDGLSTRRDGGIYDSGSGNGSLPSRGQAGARSGFVGGTRVLAPSDGLIAQPASSGAQDASAGQAASETPARDRIRAKYEGMKAKAALQTGKAKDYAYDKTPDRFKNPSDLQVRLRTGFVYITLSLAMTLISNVTTVVLLCITAGLCAGEFFYILRSDAKMPNELLGTIAAVAYPLFVWRGGLEGAMVVTGLLLLALLVWYVFWIRTRIVDVGISFFGAAYTGMLLSSLVIVRAAIAGVWGGVLVCGIMASVWVTDGFAYLVGSKLGKHKMAPRISPKKSWEGFFGGLVGSVLVWCLMTLIPGVEMTIVQATIFGVVVGLFGVLGDLAESRIKRNSGVKDSGTIMPGHGGLLDRTDSMFLASVTSAILLIGFGCIPWVY